MSASLCYHYYAAAVVHPQARIIPISVSSSLSYNAISRGDIQPNSHSSRRRSRCILCEGQQRPFRALFLLPLDVCVSRLLRYVAVVSQPAHIAVGYYTDVV